MGQKQGRHKKCYGIRETATVNDMKAKAQIEGEHRIKMEGSWI
jgi:hypothetical protein